MMILTSVPVEIPRIDKPGMVASVEVEGEVSGNIYSRRLVLQPLDFFEKRRVSVVYNP